MDNNKKQSNAEVLDVLFAVALGEGFLWGMQEYRDHLVAGEILASAEITQGFCRVLLTFLLIILSWLHFRRSTLGKSHYPTGEFVTDIMVAVTYMTLFLFVTEATAYYVVVTFVWVLYAIARYEQWRGKPAYLVFGLAFIAYFGGIAMSGSLFSGDTFEWLRLLLATLGVIAYRPLDRRLDPHVTVEESA